MKIVIACDSFKGSLTAPQACGIIAEAVRAACPAADVICLPLADGGEGTADVLLSVLHGQRIACPGICGPLPDMRLTAAFGWVPGTALAIVESAAACGLPLLTPQQRDPLRTTTRGVGELLAAAVTKGARQIFLALGGSATVDGGTGAARALGWRFLDAAGADVPEGGGALSLIRRIVPPVAPLTLPPITVLCDVRNPLCGAQGAARIFGPQKGATPAMVETLDNGLRHLADLLPSAAGLDVSELPGAGAAGGFGGGAVAFFGARLVPGIEAIAAACRFEDAARGADWIITGEGCFDAQSLQGKVVSGVRDVAGRTGARVAVLAGRVRLSQTAWRRAGFSAVAAAVTGDVDDREAFAQARPRLATAARRFLAGRQFSDRGRGRPTKATPC